MTHGQAAAVLSRWLRTFEGVGIPAGDPQAFTDLPGTAFATSVTAMSDLGVLRGFTDGTARPGAP